MATSKLSLGLLELLFHLICQVSVYVREISTCVLFITLKIMIFFPHVAKWIRQFQWKRCWPVVTPQTASGAKIYFGRKFLCSCFMLVASWPMALAFFCCIVFSIAARETKPTTRKYLTVALNIRHSNDRKTLLFQFHPNSQNQEMLSFCE